MAIPSHMVPCNPGSCGHPSLCARPCIYMAKNGACHVEGCNFCHMTHDVPVMKLNQRQRYVLQRLDVKEKLDLILAAARAGLQRKGLTYEAGSFIQLLEEASKHARQGLLRSHKKQVYDLRKALIRMSLADIIKTFEDVLPNPVLQSFQDLRQRYQAAAVQSARVPAQRLYAKTELSLKEVLAFYPAPEVQFPTF
ncbi:hypothetical protein AK812_SmicGene14412 [Symbiodinium microadriaticum]|uniref:C3H1-type domain-containing protein n=1 Tax=Symbiodinium microadriaticum TaxID=2951 RepID=A0A1Q9E5K2_SYMMI|nr:hypothetical protein AK812_SmicGene14412 [Symbiodinium microadriaticum]